MKKRPIIMDTDPEIDNTLAIAIALFSGELDVRLITTVTCNVGADLITHNNSKRSVPNFDTLRFCYKLPEKPL